VSSLALNELSGTALPFLYYIYLSILNEEEHGTIQERRNLKRLLTK